MPYNVNLDHDEHFIGIVLLSEGNIFVIEMFLLVLRW
jgi:hypothetical protein